MHPHRWNSTLRIENILTIKYLKEMKLFSNYFIQVPTYST